MRRPGGVADPHPDHDIGPPVGSLAAPEVDAPEHRRPEERDLARRSRLLALVLRACVIGSGVGSGFALVELVATLSATTAANVAVALGLFATFVGLAWLNARGHVEIAGLMTGAALVVGIGAELVAVDLQNGGYGWVDAPGWDLMTIGLTVVALTLGRRHAVLMLALFLAALGVILWLVPAQASLLDDMREAGMLPATGASPAVALVTVVWRTMVLAVATTAIGMYANHGAMQALRARDDFADLARRRRLTLQQREAADRDRQAQQRWTLQIIASLERALSEGALFVPPPLPESWRASRDLVALQGLLANAGRRLAAGQQAERAFVRLREHVRDLPQRLHEDRAAGARADGAMPLYEALLLVDVPGGTTGYAPADAFLVDEHYFLGLLAAEEAAASQEILVAIAEFGGGNRRRRLSNALLGGRYGDLVFGLNWLFDHAVPDGRGDALRTPFS